MMMSLGDELGGPERAKAMITAQGGLAHPEIHRGAVQEDRHVSRYYTFLTSFFSSFQLNHLHTAPNRLSLPPLPPTTSQTTTAHFTSSLSHSR